MENETAPLARLGMDAIDLRWRLKDIAANRSWIINKEHLAQLVDLGRVEIRDDVPFLTATGRFRSREGLASPRKPTLNQRYLNR
jgi:hypothetical protein